MLELYGIKDAKEATSPRNCLLARRLVERGVRFVQLYPPRLGPPRRLASAIKTDSDDDATRPAAALLTDLKQRGLLDDTLVIWGGEFGRTPMASDATARRHGRDHHPDGFTDLAGRRRRASAAHVYGATDDFGFNAVENRVHVHDLHATILHLLGLDHDAADLPLPRPRLPPDRRARQRRAGDPGLTFSPGGRKRYSYHRPWLRGLLPWRDDLRVVRE